MSERPDFSDLDDEALLDELGGALADHPDPPAEVVATAKELLTWRTVDAELAQLTFDSLLDGAGRTRGGENARMLTFSAGDDDVDVEVVDTGSVCRVVGQLSPPRQVTVTARIGAGEVSGRSDELGRFVLELPSPTGPVTLTWSGPDGRLCTSAAVVL